VGDGGGRTAAGGASAFPTQILAQDLEAEAQRPVRLQVVAGRCNHPSKRMGPIAVDERTWR